MAFAVGVVVDILLMVVSVAGLALSSEKFVSYATEACEVASLSPVFTAVVVVGFGTGIPELFTAALASLSHRPSIGVSSALGSTALNVTLVAGLSAVVSAPAVASRTLRKEGVAMVVGTAFFVAVLILHLSWTFGVVGLVIFGLGITYTLRGAQPPEIAEAVVTEERASATSPRSMGYLLSIGALGLLGTLGFAEIFLQGAIGVAQHAHLSAGVTGGILISLGASLPEIATALQAARKGMAEMVLGNVIGSSFFNVAAVGSVALLLGRGRPIANMELPALAAGALVGLLWLLMRSGFRLRRLEGALLLACYVGYIIVVGR